MPDTEPEDHDVTATPEAPPRPDQLQRDREVAADVLARHRQDEAERREDFEARQVAAAKRALAKINENCRPSPWDGMPVPPDNPREVQAQVRTQAWETSLRMADLDGLAHVTLDDLAQDQHPGALRAFIENIGPDAPVQNLICVGRVGSGKTTGALAAGNLAASRGLLVRVVTHARYLAWLRPGGSPPDVEPWEIRKRFITADLAIVDDLCADLTSADLSNPAGLREASAFVRQETMELINSRLSARRPTIYTTNERSEQIDAILGPRASSRIAGGAVPLVFTGPDRRRPVSW